MTFPNLKCTEKRKTALGRFLYGIGWSAMLSFFMFFLIMIIMDGKLENEWLLFLLMFIPFLSAFLLQYGKRLAAEDTVSTLSKDKRPIVLILRAFTVDRNAFWDGAGSELNFEQNLANILSCAGPVVAVGRPGEKLAPSGAMRLYIPNENWKNKVRQLMDEAKIVALILFSENLSVRGDKFEGFRWEIREAMKRLDPQKLIFILPAATRLVLSVASYSFHSRKKVRLVRQKSFEDFTRLIIRAMPYKLPTSIDKAQFLYFDSNGQPKILRTRAGGLLGFSLALRPFFLELGIKPPSVNPLKLLWTFNVVYRSIFIAFILMMIIMILAGIYINLLK